MSGKGSGSETVPYEESSEGSKKENDQLESDLKITNLTPAQTASLVASFLPLCQANLAKVHTEDSCVARANAMINSNSSLVNTWSNDCKKNFYPRTNVGIGNASSRSNDISEHDKINLSGKRKKSVRKER